MLLRSLTFLCKLTELLTLWLPRDLLSSQLIGDKAQLKDEQHLNESEQCGVSINCY